MKKSIFLWAVVLMAVAGAGYADETAVKSLSKTGSVSDQAAGEVTSSTSPWYLWIAGGVDLPGQNWQTAYTLGGGGSVGVGYKLSDDWAVEVDLDNFYFAGTGSSTGSITDDELRVLPTVRYTLTGSDIRPYLLGGLGIDGEFLSGPGGSTAVTSFDMAAGLGVELKAAKETYIFVEGKWNFLIASGPGNSSITGQDVPISAGVKFGL